MQGKLRFHELMNSFCFFRLPNYPITDAVDGLTLGSVNFLPERISVCYYNLPLWNINIYFLVRKEGTIPFQSATEAERQEILPRLQQILTARVAIAELSIQFTSVVISMLKKTKNSLHDILFIVENGILTLAVDGEFEVKLGITSDYLFAPWHVYKTKLFLRDSEEPGKIKSLNIIQS